MEGNRADIICRPSSVQEFDEFQIEYLHEENEGII